MEVRERGERERVSSDVDVYTSDQYNDNNNDTGGTLIYLGGIRSDSQSVRL